MCMEKVVTNIKSLNIRMPKELWVFLKRRSIDQERTMNEIINELIRKYESKFDNKTVSP